MVTIDHAIKAWTEELVQEIPRFVQEKLDPLALEVHRWFEEATSRFATPSVGACRSVAMYIVAFRDDPNHRKPDGRVNIIKYGKIFLRHIESERQQIEKRVLLASRGRPFGNWLKQDKEMLVRIEEIQKHMNALIPTLSSKLDHKPDPIRKLASVAQAVWAKANDGRFPKSPNPGDPLCRFLVQALKAAKQNHNPATITAVLRGRRRMREGHSSSPK
jgi:hypothetical protein